ncbi:uncharacterized protein LOC131327444 [Rhododendron vialii]|uniref:uncharacterized protein LOC131327444 n=1 Tax=Rhododendron vialii TaxID=182163 RepID=UPI00265FF0B4|nr:uncharacterized protein LOC131327444 [Rhododendron vialii]
MDYCPRCDETPEDVNHIFRTCPKAIDFWKGLHRHHWLSVSLNMPVKDWIIFNSKKKTPFCLDVNMPWGNLKLNTDGCFYESTYMTGYGGVIRDSSGIWILGYYGKATSTQQLGSGDMSYIQRPHYHFGKGQMSNVTIQSDSSVAVGFCNEGSPIDHPHRHIVEEARRLAAQIVETPRKFALADAMPWVLVILGTRLRLL